MQSTHHGSFLLPLYSLKAALYLWTAWYHWTVPECLLWVTKLATANLLDFIQSRARSIQFLSPGPPSTSLPHPQSPGSEHPPECSSQPPWGPLATATGSTQHHRPAIPFKMAKGTELDPICSELLYCSCAGETKTSLPSIFAIVLLGSPTGASAENICHGKPVIFKTLTFTSCSGTLTSDKKLKKYYGICISHRQITKLKWNVTSFFTSDYSSKKTK